jgi:hypothetical protein
MARHQRHAREIYDSERGEKGNAIIKKYDRWRRRQSYMNSKDDRTCGVNEVIQ